MSKQTNLQPVQRTQNGIIPNVQNPPLQIQPKPVVSIFQNHNQSRIIQSQATFPNQYLTNFSPQNIGRTQAFNVSSSNCFTLSLAPIQAKPIENSNNLTVLPSNFPPIQMRPNTNPTKQPPVFMPTTSANMTSAVAGGYYRDWILEAIDKLRERKARPDAERISTLMKRYHNIPLEDTVLCLNKLADSGSVVCVDYKGNISYRNPYKWRKNSANGGGIMNAPSITNRILEAFKHLDKTRGCDQSLAHKTGYSIAEIEQALMVTQASSSVELTKTQLRHCLEREAAYGKLMRRSDCAYVIDENGEKKMRKAAAMQAKKSALAHKPTANKTIAAAPHPITIATTNQNNLTNTFTTFSVQPMQSFTPQLAQFVSAQNERQILPMLTTPSPYASLTLTSLNQPSPILPKQTPPTQMPILKCEPSSPQNYVSRQISKPELTPNPQSSAAEDESNQMSSVVTTIATPIFEMRATNKLSRRGRPPGSKNKRYQNDLENATVHQNKKQKIDPENHVTSVSAGSSCISVSNSDQTVPATGSVIELCSECKGPQTDFDKFLCCNDCSFKVHPSCLHYWPELTERARQSQWQCSLCKTCSICNDRSSKESVYICDGCDKGFHPNCHEPKIEEPVSSNAAWICSNCHNEGFRIKTEEMVSSPMEINGDSSDTLHFTVNTNLQSKLKSSTNDEEERHRNVGPDLKSRSEEVSKWTVSDVCDWLTEGGFGLQSGSFRDQEIDGACLLLMKRIDVLTELNIKLGPAVKIYERIKKIQNEGNIWRFHECF